jgi:hypothetical protein
VGLFEATTTRASLRVQVESDQGTYQRGSWLATKPSPQSGSAGTNSTANGNHSIAPNPFPRPL